MSYFFEDFGLNQDIMKTIQPHASLCICCLERNVPFISILTCTHSDFLNNFEKPEIKPLNQVICHRCHNMLKKIEQFKLQVENSYKILEAHANNPESINHRQTNLKFHKIIDINIPETDPNQDEQTNSETQNSFENITCTTENNLENIIKEEKNLENIINKENSLENITCLTENNLENIINEEKNLENIINKENSLENIINKEKITCTTENSLENIIKEENDFENIDKEQNFFENITCKEEINFECTDTKIQYNLAQVIPNKKINENTYLHKKLKNIETPMSIINKDESNDGISLLETSLQNIVSSTLTRMLQRAGNPNPFDRLTKGKKGFIDDAPMQVIDDVEIKDAANKSVISDAPVAKKPKLDKRKDIIETKPTKRKENSQTNTKIFDIHTGEYLYQCDICQSNFINKHHLNTHIRIHTGEKPYKCDICQRAFSRKETLNDHIRVHTGEKPYKCDICQRSFNRSSGLNTHIRTHTGKNLYKCNTCERSFSRSSSLNRHVRIHTGEKPYKCDICERSFSQSSTLITHKRIHLKNK